MKYLKAFNREQLTLGSALVLGLLMLASLLGGGGPARAARQRPTSERPYGGPPSAAPEYVQDKFGVYWDGRDIFSPVVVDKLPVPELEPPVPRTEPLVLPPLRPGPALEALNRSADVAVKYRPLVGAPAADLPTDAQFAQLKALTEPEMPAAADRRAERMRDSDVIYRTNNRPPMEGQIIAETPEGVKFKGKDQPGVGGVIPWSDIRKDRRGKPVIERSWTFEKEYEHRARELAAGDAGGRIELGAWCRSNGLLPEAKKEYREAIEALRARGDFSMKEFFPAVYALGDLHRETGDFNGALELCGEVVRWTPFEGAEVTARAGDALRALGLLEAAQEKYEGSLKASPRFTRGRVALARTLYDLGRDAESAAAIAELFAKYADTLQPAERAEANVVRGLALMRAGDLRAAREAVMEALRLEPKNAEALNAAGVIDLLAPSAAGAPAAENRFFAALLSNQYLGDAWLNLGALALSAGKVAEAEAMFAAALQRDPSCADAVAGQALAELLKNQPKEAEAKLDASLKRDPRHTYAQYVRAHLKLQQGAYDDALAGFAAALRSEFFFLPAYSGGAMAYLASARALETAVAADAAGRTRNREAAAQHRVNAQTLLETIRDFDPARASTHLALGCVLAVQGRGGEAERAFQRVSELNPAADALLAYGRAYIVYWHGDGDAKQRLAAARALFNVGAQFTASDPVDKGWIALGADAAKKIAEWQDTSVLFEDRFDRPDASHVGYNWIHRELDLGVKIALEGGRARFSGKQAIKDMGLRVLERDVQKQDFMSFEATLYPESGRCEFGVSLYHTKQSEAQWLGLHAGLDMNGRLRLLTAGSVEFGSMRLQHAGQEAPRFELPNPKEITIRLQRRQDERRNWVLDVLIWNPAKSEWVSPFRALPVHTAGSHPSYRVAVWARAPLGQDYALSVDDARVLLKRTGP